MAWCHILTILDMSASICTFVGEKAKNISYYHLVYTSEMRLRELKVSSCVIKSLVWLVLRNFQKIMNILYASLTDTARTCQFCQTSDGISRWWEFFEICDNTFQFMSNSVCENKSSFWVQTSNIHKKGFTSSNGVFSVINLQNDQQKHIYNQSCLTTRDLEENFWTPGYQESLLSSANLQVLEWNHCCLWTCGRSCK